MNKTPHSRVNNPSPLKKVLFLCTGNSCRSQMAEAWVNRLRHQEWKAYSAGIETHGMNPNAVAVMSESGVDMSTHYSKHIDEIADEGFDLVITVCDHAAQHCPTIENYKQTSDIDIKHVPFDDPPKLAESISDPRDKLKSYRTVRDQIRAFIESPEFC